MAAGTCSIPVEQMLGHTPCAGAPWCCASRQVPREHKGCSGGSFGMLGTVDTQHARLPQQMGAREDFLRRDASSTRDVGFLKVFWTESVHFQKKGAQMLENTWNF